MSVYVLTCKKMVTNAGGDRVESKVTGPAGEWGIKEAADLMLAHKAVFVLRDGTRVSDLAMLPEC